MQQLGLIQVSYRIISRYLKFIEFCFVIVGCVYGGNLTAILLPDEEMVTVAAKQSYVKHSKKVKLSYKEDEYMSQSTNT